MGKGSRSSKANTAGFRGLSREERLTVLKRAACLVAEFNAGQPQCIEAVALLDRVAGLLRVKAEPVPVAVAAQGPRGSHVLGTAAADVVPLTDGGKVMQGRRSRSGTAPDISSCTRGRPAYCSIRRSTRSARPPGSPPGH